MSKKKYPHEDDVEGLNILGGTDTPTRGWPTSSPSDGNRQRTMIQTVYKVPCRTDEDGTLWHFPLTGLSYATAGTG